MMRTKINIVISLLGLLLGFSAFICFCLVYSNIEAGVWALLSGKCPFYFKVVCLKSAKYLNLK